MTRYIGIRIDMKGVQFRLYTENLNRDKIIKYANIQGLENLTYYNANGKYNGVEERTLIIEYIAPIESKVGIDAIRDAFKILADYCKVMNSQVCVLLTEQKIDFELY